MCKKIKKKFCVFQKLYKNNIFGFFSKILSKKKKKQFIRETQNFAIHFFLQSIMVQSRAHRSFGKEKSIRLWYRNSGKVFFIQVKVDMRHHRDLVNSSASDKGGTCGFFLVQRFRQLTLKYFFCLRCKSKKKKEKNIN